MTNSQVDIRVMTAWFGSNLRCGLLTHSIMSSSEGSPSVAMLRPPWPRFSSAPGSLSHHVSPATNRSRASAHQLIPVQRFNSAILMASHLTGRSAPASSFVSSDSFLFVDRAGENALPWASGHASSIGRANAIYLARHECLDTGYLSLRHRVKFAQLDDPNSSGLQNGIFGAELRNIVGKEIGPREYSAPGSLNAPCG